MTTTIIWDAPIEQVQIGDKLTSDSDDIVVTAIDEDVEIAGRVGRRFHGHIVRGYGKNLKNAYAWVYYPGQRVDIEREG